MVDGLPPHLGPVMRQAAQAVDVILKQIGIDGADPQSKSLRILSRGLPVVRLIPGDMQSDTGARAGHPLDHRGVCQLFGESACRSRPGEDFEARAGIAVAPGWSLDGKGLNAYED